MVLELASDAMPGQVAANVALTTGEGATTGGGGAAAAAEAGAAILSPLPSLGTRPPSARARARAPGLFRGKRGWGWCARAEGCGDLCPLRVQNVNKSSVFWSTNRRSAGAAEYSAAQRSSGGASSLPTRSLSLYFSSLQSSSSVLPRNRLDPSKTTTTRHQRPARSEPNTQKRGAAETHLENRWRPPRRATSRPRS